MDVLGYVAAVLTTVCWLPQLRRTVRTRSASDISWPYLAVLMVGICAWLAYGIGSRDGAIIAGNAMTLVLLAWLVGAKLVFELGARPRPGSATAATPGGDPGPTI
jgi:MtN3 and saliva related transmembrane protein